MDTPILDRLKERQVFSIEETRQATFIFCEGCDNYFSETLTKAEILALAEELIALANKA